MKRVWLLVVCALAVGCSEDAPEPAAAPLMPVATGGQADPATTPPVNNDGFSGAVSGKNVALERSGPGWSVTIDGTQFRTAIEADRIKLKDDAGTTVAKVKTKDGGFKVYGADEQAKLKFKKDGDRFKVKNDDGDTLHKLVIPNSDPASLVMAVEELSVEERVAAYIYAREFLFR